MNKKIEFKDIEGTTICVGDKVLLVPTSWHSTAGLAYGIVERFSPKNIFFKNVDRNGKWEKTENHAKMMYDECSRRVLIIKGELKEYTKTKDIENG